MNEMANSLLKSWVESNFEYSIAFEEYKNLTERQKEEFQNEFIRVATEHYNDKNEATETFWAMLDEFEACSQ